MIKKGNFPAQFKTENQNQSLIVRNWNSATDDGLYTCSVEQIETGQKLRLPFQAISSWAWFFLSDSIELFLWKTFEKKTVSVFENSSKYFEV